MMTDAGKADEISGPTFGGYSTVHQAADALRTMTGEISATTTMAAMRALKDLPNPIGEPITCDPRPYPNFSGCSQGWLMLRQEADGTSKPITDEFVKPKS